MPPPAADLPRVLSIAGSDSGGGAGIQADLKAFARAGVHGMTAITAITAQNTVGVVDVHQIPGPTIVAQVRAIAEDIGVDAVKIGMLGDVPTIAAVEEAIELVGSAPIVLDPVMVAESGAALLAPEARRALVERIVPRAAVVTPNLAEAWELARASGDDTPDADPEDPEALARAVHALGAGAVVVTGGHAAVPDDVFYDGSHLERLPGQRYPDGAAHGSGCTHSSTLAARLAHGDDPLEAARVARRVAAEAVRDGLREIGAGAGPVDVLGLRSRAQAGAPRRGASGGPPGDTAEDPKPV
jgi:hydroxymethylpyrimidine/phosphomethylpyrimidine kinase